MLNDLYFKKKFNKGQIHNTLIEKLTNEEKEYLENRYNDIFRTYKETIWRIINDIEYLPKCSECEKYVKIRYRKTQLYYHTCGNKECIHKRKGNGPKEACLLKYGVENQFQREEVKEKIQQHHLIKYGHESHTQSIEWKEKEKTKLLNKYGVENQFQRKEIKEKIKQVLLERYGVTHYSKCEQSKQHMSIVASSCEFQTKRNNTLRKNNTWRSSKAEIYIYNELIKYFKDVKKQYSSDLYPFACDFYIPSIDTYIEYNGSDLHNHRPYTNSEDDLKEVSLLIEKSNKIKQKTKKPKTRYDQRIYVWTDLDVRKRNIAKQNNLNFIEFWDIESFNKFIENYK